MTDYRDRERQRDETWDRRTQASADAWTYHPWRQAFKWFVGILLVCFVLSIIGNAVGILSIYWGGERAQLTLKPRLKKQIFTPENAATQIAFFHDQCEGVNAQAKIVGNLAQTYEADFQAAHFAKDPIRQEQAQEALSQDATNLAGAKNVLQSRAADYNSRSQQSTANVFKGHGLPRRIDPPNDERQLADYHIDCGAGR